MSVYHYIQLCDGVSVLLDGNSTQLSKIGLTRNEVHILGGNSEVHLNIPLTSVSAIQIHQPIFGSNYIEIEYMDSTGNHKLIVTFNKGGATEFAQSFFRVTDGRVDTSNHQSTAPSLSMEDKETSKKNN